MIYLPSEFPQETDLMYLNHAAAGPWPRRTAQVVANFAETSMRRGSSDYPQWLETESRLRGRLARLINAPTADAIALVQNTSEGLSIVSQGLDWAVGDEVVGLAGDFCSNQMVWQALAGRGVHYQPVAASGSVDPEGRLIAAITDRTRLMAISTVHFATGYRFDLARVARACRDAGVLLSVDAIQSLGARHFDLDEVDADFVTSGSHKWLLSPEGIGFFYARPELRDRLELHRFGWAMRERTYAFEDEAWEPAASARRFEAGSPNMIGIQALDASLSLFEELGMSFVEQRLAENIGYLVDELRQMPGVELVSDAEPEKLAGILTFRAEGVDQMALYTRLMERRLVCSPRAGGIRLAPHFYTPETLLARALDTVKHEIKNMR